MHAKDLKITISLDRSTIQRMREKLEEANIGVDLSQDEGPSARLVPLRNTLLHHRVAALRDCLQSFQRVQWPAPGRVVLSRLRPQTGTADRIVDLKIARQSRPNGPFDSSDQLTSVPSDAVLSNLYRVSKSLSSIETGNRKHRRIKRLENKSLNRRKLRRWQRRF